MNVPKKFWSEEAKEPAHKDIKQALEKKVGKKKVSKKKPAGKAKKDKKGDCPSCGK